MWRLRCVALAVLAPALACGEAATTELLRRVGSEDASGGRGDAWPGELDAGAGDASPPTVEEQLERIRRGMVGRWTGIVTTPWVPPYRVTVTFEADQHYSGDCAEPGCVAFYYGTDADDPDKRWEVSSIDPRGAGQGQLWIVFSPGNSLPGTLEQIVLSEDARRLTFQYWHTGTGGNYGPVSFDLTRLR